MYPNIQEPESSLTQTKDGNQTEVSFNIEAVMQLIFHTTVLKGQIQDQNDEHRIENVLYITNDREIKRNHTRNIYINNAQLRPKPNQARNI